MKRNNLILLIVIVFFVSCKNRRHSDLIDKQLKENTLNIGDSIVKQYDENGVLRQKSYFKNNLKNKWWSYYDLNGNIEKKEEYVIINDSTSHKNQVIYFTSNGDTIKDKSSFFYIKLPDTLVLGKNVGQLYFNSKYNDIEEKLLAIIIKNEYSDYEVKHDTFGEKPNYSRFGVFAHKTGVKKISGSILETLFYVEDIGNDSAQAHIMTFKKYFEKEVYVKDTVN